MRVFGLALAGVLALTVNTVAAQAAPLKSHMRPVGAGPAPRVVQVWDGNRPGWHPVPNGRGGGWQQMPSHFAPMERRMGSAAMGPNAPPGGWGLYPGPGVPTYWVWGPSGGTFDYPFADWRGPTGGWGNP
jgi:hypothetical protein